jgi:5-methylcytosine-specific restriction endonuclease McrA
MNGVGGTTWARIRAHHKKAAMNAGTPCAICGTPIDWDAHPHSPAAYQLDHIIPLSRGGHRHEPSNLQAVHRYCNRLKSDKNTVSAAAPNIPKAKTTGMQMY